jgi:phytoene dehydrogenase-like protein
METEKADIIIIGAGACGLTAARELVMAGKKVCVLEARNRLGGRIYTYEGSGFSKPVEAGAEFIHGDLPFTQSLLKEAGISSYSMTGINYQVKNGQLLASENFFEDFPALQEKLTALEEDIPLSGFLDKYLFEEKYKNLCNTIIRFAEGYDAADINKVSTFALRDEW